MTASPGGPPTPLNVAEGRWGCVKLKGLLPLSSQGGCLPDKGDQQSLQLKHEAQSKGRVSALRLSEMQASPQGRETSPAAWAMRGATCGPPSGHSRSSGLLGRPEDKNGPGMSSEPSHLQLTPLRAWKPQCNEHPSVPSSEPLETLGSSSNTGHSTEQPGLQKLSAPLHP